MWKSKALLLMTSVWKMCVCVCVFVGIVGAMLGYPSFFLEPLFPGHSFYRSSFTGAFTGRRAALSRARSTTTQMTYGASCAWTQPSSQSHFIKYESKGNIWRSKSGGGSTQRCIWPRGLDCIKGRRKKGIQIDDLLFVIRGIFGERPKEGSVACPRA